MSSSTRYTVEITFNSAQNLPVGDIRTVSCDPYLKATITSPPPPNTSDAPLTWRTPTIHHTRDPTWNNKWIVSGVPASGFSLSIRVMDEDRSDRDDRLGKAYAHFAPLGAGFHEEEKAYKIQKRKGSFRPWIQTYLVAILPGQKVRKHNRVVVSVRVLGKAKDQNVKRIYTVGPSAFSWACQKSHSTSTFVATKFQLTGPVPDELRHEYVAFKPIIRLIFDNVGISGHILNLGLRKQYRTVYSYSKSTTYGVVAPEGDDGPSAMQHMDNGEPSTRALAERFLELVKYGEGGRLFTYVITLDGEWRFTETGDEFAINMLSKHSMHADAARIIAFSGEFMVRRIPQERSEDVVNQKDKDPSLYELIIDNDSGTYRPHAELLPLFQSWLSAPERLGGLGRVTGMQAFDETLKKLKEELKEEKKRAAGGELPAKRGLATKGGGKARSISSGELGDNESISSEEVERVVKKEHDENIGNEGHGDGNDDRNRHRRAPKLDHANGGSTDSGVHI
ncbi:hypothetical protein BD410DRAFT_770703 [Rickenella mellea]|uniref:C2 domain-containing protein n=1 Tax=Rickenella mellea TaxID=50990 RepID=A0A4Y7Q4N5_9AGAM|nr:hypothetical protein BD410DRAFT_770703 [Rickenella mellea]